MCIENLAAKRACGKSHIKGPQGGQESYKVNSREARRVTKAGKSQVQQHMKHDRPGMEVRHPRSLLFGSGYTRLDLCGLESLLTLRKTPDLS